MRALTILRSAALLALASSAGCAMSSASPDFEDEHIADNTLSFEEFEAELPKSPRTGAYIVEGDIRIDGIDALRDYYEEHVPQPGALTVHRYNSADNTWSSTAKRTISYCVSTSFGSRYDDVVTGLADAAIAWEATADVMFTHRSDQDGNCTSSNNNVTFNVVPVSGTSYNASSFFPYYSRSNRELEIDTGNAWNDGCKSFKGIMMHELGHSLGFRHEHIWLYGTSSQCTTESSSNARQVTSYDVSSVMHYAQCGGKGCVDYSISSLDEQGSQSLYGAPGLWGRSRFITKAGGYQSTGKWVAGDFNGDGKDDVAMAWSDGGNYSIDAYLSNGSSFTKYRWITKAGSYQSEGRLAAGDFNGDGKDDIALTFEDGSSGKYSIDAYLSNGSSFSQSRWLTKVGNYQSEGQWAAGDFNGDGKDDLAVSFDDSSSGKYSINAYLSSGSSFGYNRWLTQVGNYQSEGKWAAGDFNGDGKDDFALAFEDGSSGKYSINAYLSSGSSFGYNRWLTEVGSYKSSAQWAAGDFDGDGKADLSKTWDDGNISVDVELSIGSAFAAQRWDTKDGGWVSSSTSAAGDFDGDGYDDLAYIFNDNGNYSIDIHGY